MAFREIFSFYYSVNDLFECLIGFSSSINDVLRSMVGIFWSFFRVSKR